MRRVLTCLLAACLCSLNIYAQKRMKIKIQKISNIEDFPSGSGLGANGEKLYAIGDDSPFLYVIDSDFQVENKISLLEVPTEDFKSNRIKKKKKADFETLEIISENELVIFGSGSKSPQRDVFVRVFLNESTIERYSISMLYTHLRELPLLKDLELNIEATAFSDGFLYLFNRTNNIIIKFDYQEFISYLKTENLPKIEIIQVSLPKIEGIEAGFSGATFFDKSKILFTASVEATDDTYNDGEIIGSLAGIIDISDFQKAKVTHYNFIPSENPIKVESVTILPSKSTRNTNVVFITDDDNGNTKLIKATLKI
ncbi:DUF6929 family protein [Capnocytophaga felis]|nr:hypothetical protein [Capnocytophaga felis]